MPLGRDARFHVTAHSVLLDGLRLTALRSTGHRARLEDPDHLVLLVAGDGGLETGGDGGAVEVRGEAGAILPPGERTTVIPGRYRGYGLRVPMARLALQASRNPEDGWRPDVARPARPSPRLVRGVRYAVQEVEAEAAPAPTVRAAQGIARLLLDLLLDDLAAASGGPAPRAVAPAGLAEVRRAEAALRARFGDAVSISALAGELGVSTRALQAAFRRYRGTTPYAFLLACRYEAVRARLLRPAPGETVTSVALDCGITHLGRFAGDYRARFGEAPSATLARGRERDGAAQSG